MWDVAEKRIRTNMLEEWLQTLHDGNVDDGTTGYDSVQ
jgi:hypothetical protein